MTGNKVSQKLSTGLTGGAALPTYLQRPPDAAPHFENRQSNRGSEPESLESRRLLPQDVDPGAAERDSSDGAAREPGEHSTMGGSTEQSSSYFSFQGNGSGSRSQLKTLPGLAEKELPLEDVAALAQLGYKQETPRPFNRITSLALNFVNVCVLLNVPLMRYALSTGGPPTVLWSWWPVSLLVGCVALSLAELCSAIPSMGGLYSFALRLGGPAYGPYAAWTTGWFSYIANIAGLTNSAQAAATLVVTIWKLNSEEWSPETQELRNIIYGFYSLLIVIVGLVNIFGEQLLPTISQWSSYFLILGTLLIALWPLIAAPTLQPADFVFITFQNATGWDSNIIVALIGLLPAASSITGFDASSHIAEETTVSRTSASWSLVWTVIVGSVSGYFLWVCQFFSIQDYQTTLTSPYPSYVQIWLDTVGPIPATLFLFIMLLSFLMTSLSSVTVSSRILFALVRDNALPFSTFWYTIHPRLKSPVRAIVLTSFLALLLGLFTLFSDVVFPALTSVSTVCFFISCVIPIALRITVAKGTFVRGQWNLGRWSGPSGWMSVGFVGVVTVIFMFPTALPISPDLSNFNFAPIVLGTLLLVINLFWLAYARFRFTGPVRTITEEEMKELERRVGSGRA